MTNASRLVALALVLTALAGCHRRGAVVDDRRALQYTRNLIALAAQDSGCASAQLTIQQIHPEVYTVNGCSVPLEYWLQCNQRNHCRWERLPTVNEAGALAMHCAPQNVQQAMTADPTVRYATGCGQSGVFAMQCAAMGMGCGWVARGAAPSGPVIVEQSQVPVVQMQAQAQVQEPQLLVVAPAPTANAQVLSPPPSGPAMVLQAQINAQREALLSCVDNPGALSLTLHWGADGQVILQMPPQLAGTAAEGCMQSVVATLRVQASAPGQTVVALR